LNKPNEPSKTSLLVIFLTVFIDLLGFGIVMPLLPLYADLFSADATGITIGLLMASFSIMQFLFAPIWGSLSDRVGRRPVILFGLGGSVFFYGMFGLATVYESLFGLFATRIGAGIAAATIPTAQAYIADSTTHDNRARGMALIGMAFGLGFTLGPMFAYFAVPSEGQGTPGASPGFIAAGLSAVALLLAMFCLPESLKKDSQSAARRWWDGSAWKAAFGKSSIAFLLIAFFICIFSFANFETTLSLLIKGSASFADAPFEFTFRQVCLTFAVIGLLVAIVQGGIVRRLAKKVPERTLAIAGALIEVVGFGLLALAASQASMPLLFGALAVIVAGYSCLQPSLYSLLSRWTDAAQQGQVLGVGQSVSALARIFGSGLGIPLLKAQILAPYLLGSMLMVGVAVFVHLACRSGQDA
jgi:MFS family permease